MQRVMVFGAASGIAQATARRWAEKGAKFYLVDVNEDRLKAVADDLGVRGSADVQFEAVDLTDLTAHEVLVERSLQALGGVDVVLIAHGLLGSQEESQRDFAQAERVFKVNFVSAASLLTRLAIEMEKQGSGVIAVISSVAGDRGRKSVYVYGAAKGALAIFADGLRHQLAESGVHVVTIKPGYVDTPMTAHVSKKGLLWASPDRVARDIVRAVDRRVDRLYTPWFWRYIMLIIRCIPESIFKKLDL